MRSISLTSGLLTATTLFSGLAAARCNPRPSSSGYPTANPSTTSTPIATTPATSTASIYSTTSTSASSSISSSAATTTTTSTSTAASATSTAVASSDAFQLLASVDNDETYSGSYVAGGASSGYAVTVGTSESSDLSTITFTVEADTGYLIDSNTGMYLGAVYADSSTGTPVQIATYSAADTANFDTLGASYILCDQPTDGVALDCYVEAEPTLDTFVMYPSYFVSRLLILDSASASSFEGVSLTVESASS